MRAMHLARQCGRAAFMSSTHDEDPDDDNGLRMVSSLSEGSLGASYMQGLYIQAATGCSGSLTIAVPVCIGGTLKPETSRSSFHASLATVVSKNGHFVMDVLTSRPRLWALCGLPRRWHARWSGCRQTRRLLGSQRSVHRRREPIQLRVASTGPRPSTGHDY